MNSRVSSAAQCNCAPSCGTRFAASCSIVQQHCRDRRYRPGLRSQSQWHVHMTRDEVVPSWLRGGGCQDDLGVVGSAVVNSRGLAHTETTVRDPYDPAPLDVSRCEWVVGGLHGRPVRRVRQRLPPGRWRTGRRPDRPQSSSYPVGGPYYTAHPGRKQALTTNDTAPGTGEKHLVKQP